MTTPVTPGADDANAQDGKSAVSATTSTNDSVGQASFLQSMLSVAQNAATSLTSNIPLTLPASPSNRPKAQDTSDKMKPSVIPAQELSAVPDEESPEPGREPAIKTLGMGELNLATLGIDLPGTQSAQKEGVLHTGSTTSKSGGGSGDDGLNRNEPLQFPERAQTLSTVSVNNIGPEAGSDNLVTPTNPPRRTPFRTSYTEDAPFHGSTATIRGDMTPERNSAEDKDDGLDGDRKRSGSFRNVSNAVSRHRGMSATSGNTPPQLVPRPTGFAVASKRRNRDFHNLFRSVPEDDYLIEDYGCALQKEILLQGRLFVSEGHICFYSNILGWVTTLVISFDEVMSVEKKSTALLFPNAIVIQTLHAKHVFASFISRDSTYDLMIGLWNVGCPQVVAGNGEAHLDGAPEGDQEEEEEDDASAGDEDEYEADTGDDVDESFTDAGAGPFEENDHSALAVSTSRGPSRRPSQLLIANGGDGTDAAAAGDFPGPKTHAPTSCNDDDKHYDKLLCDEVLPAPLGKIYALMFGSQSTDFINRLLAEEEKVLDISIPNNGEWAEQPDGKKVRNFSYVKPLGGSIGPKQTRCLITETVDFFDLESHVSVTASTQTPDVPSGGVFLVKTRYCLSWGESGGTRIISNCTVEWSGKSWIKGPIEKGASDGQIGYNKSLLGSLRREIAPKRPVGMAKASKGKGKGKRRKDTGAGEGGSRSRVVGGGSPASEPASDRNADTWGLLGPLKPVLGPLVDIIQPLLPANFGSILIAVILTWVIASRFRPESSALEKPSANTPSHLEHMWRGEEEALWDWLDDRVSLDEHISAPFNRHSNADKADKKKKGKKGVVKRTAGARIKERQVHEAIAVMEERLNALKRIADTDNSASSPSSKGEKDL